VFGISSVRSSIAIGEGAIKCPGSASSLQCGLDQCKLIGHLDNHHCVDTVLEMTSQHDPCT